jgi:hypothetical protein
MPAPTRRSLLRLGGAAALVVALPTKVASVFKVPGTPARLSRGTFAPLVGTEFHLNDGHRSYRAVLTAVDADPHAPRRDGAFSLTFLTRGRLRPANRISAVSHPHLHTIGLFVTPVGGKAGLYEAVVNS